MLYLSAELVDKSHFVGVTVVWHAPGVMGWGCTVDSSIVGSQSWWRFAGFSHQLEYSQANAENEREERQLQSVPSLQSQYADGQRNECQSFQHYEHHDWHEDFLQLVFFTWNHHRMSLCFQRIPNGSTVDVTSRFCGIGQFKSEAHFVVFHFPRRHDYCSASDIHGDIAFFNNVLQLLNQWHVVGGFGLCVNCKFWKNK